MTKHPEHENKSVAHDGGKTHDRIAEEDNAAPSKTDSAPSKLAPLAHYAMLGFAPTVSVLALIIAVIALNGNQSSKEPLGKAAAQIDSISATLPAFRGDLEKLNVSLAQMKSMQMDEHKKREIQVKEIIQSVTVMQKKMKIFPTLEDLLYVPENGTTAIPPDTGSANGKEPLNQTQAIKAAIEKLNHK